MKEQGGELNYELIRERFLVDLELLAIAVSDCRLRPVQHFPDPARGRPAGNDQGEDSDEDFFAEVIGPSVSRWVAVHGLNQEANILVIHGSLPDGSWREQANFLGSTARGHYFGPVREPETGRS